MVLGVSHLNGELGTELTLQRTKHHYSQRTIIYTSQPLVGATVLLVEVYIHQTNMFFSNIVWTNSNKSKSNLSGFLVWFRSFEVKELIIFDKLSPKSSKSNMWAPVSWVKQGELYIGIFVRIECLWLKWWYQTYNDVQSLAIIMLFCGICTELL